MDKVRKDAEDANGYKTRLVDAADCAKAEDQYNGENGKTEDLMDDEEDSESRSLLPPRDEIVQKKSKKQRKVRWNDHDGSRLAEVLVYEPSEVSDSDDDDMDSCFCTIS